MEGKHEEFWNQGDFGYVKKEVDSMMTLCKPKKKVCSKINHLFNGFTCPKFEEIENIYILRNHLPTFRSKY